MNTVSVSASIYEVTENILNLLTGDLSASSTKAYLASLRRSVSWDVPRDPSVFSIVFANIPDKYLGESGELTVGERSIVLRCSSLLYTNRERSSLARSAG